MEEKNENLKSISYKNMSLPGDDTTDESWAIKNHPIQYESIINEPISEVPEPLISYIDNNGNVWESEYSYMQSLVNKMKNNIYGQINNSKKPAAPAKAPSLKKDFSDFDINNVYNKKTGYYRTISFGDADHIEFKGSSDPYSYSKEEKQEIKKDCKYRVLLSNDGMKINYIQCPKDYVGTDEELLNIASRGENPNIRLLPYIPQFDKNGKEIKPKKTSIKSLPPRPLRPPIDQITPDAFAEKTNNLFTKEVTIDDYFNMYERLKGLNRRDFLRTITIDHSCLKNILLYNLIDNTIGLTTGIVKENGIEVISLTASNLRYNNKTCYKLDYYPTGSFDIVSNIQQFMCFFRLKLQSSVKSKELFNTSLAIRKKMEGQIISGQRVNIRTRFIGMDGKPYQIYEVLNKSRDSYIHYLENEAILLTIDPKLLSSFKSKTIKKIEKGKKAIIKDDRRLINLKKGDVVVVDAITTKATKRMSTVIVVDSSGKKQTILLKQLRPYAEADKKPVDKETNKKSSISTDINIGKAKGGEAFGKATNKPKIFITKDDYNELPY